MSSFPQSYANVVVRQATVVFGLCYIAFLSIELVAMWDRNCTCWARRNFVINVVNIIFVILQAFLIMYYPRPNLHINRFVDRCILNQPFLIKIAQTLYPGFACFVSVWRTATSPGCHQQG